MISFLTPLRATCVVALVTLLVGVTTGRVRIRRVQVEGDSMLPTLRPGDRLAVIGVRPRPGHLVVLRDPRQPERLLVKRCTAIDGSDGVRVEGDNPVHSTDSRHFGPVPTDLVLGRPLYRYAPEADAGPVWRA